MVINPSANEIADCVPIFHLTNPNTTTAKPSDELTGKLFWLPMSTKPTRLHRLKNRPGEITYDAYFQEQSSITQV